MRLSPKSASVRRKTSDRHTTDRCQDRSGQPRLGFASRPRAAPVFASADIVGSPFAVILRGQKVCDASGDAVNVSKERLGNGGI